MAIRPQEALKLREPDLKAVEEAEIKIDAYLREHYNGGKISVSIDTTKLNKRSQEELVKRYNNAGWVYAVITHSQREGSIIELSNIPTSYEWDR